MKQTIVITARDQRKIKVTIGIDVPKTVLVLDEQRTLRRNLENQIHDVLRGLNFDTREIQIK